LNDDEPKDRVVHVVAGAVTDAHGRVLIAQRPQGRHLAGGWEFPGGKLEPGEERAAGLARELREELGITIQHPRPLIRVRHAYPSREILLDLWVVTSYEGEPNGLDGQPLRWCTPDELATADLLPADRPLVPALRLPERLTRPSTAFYRVDGPRIAGTPPGGEGMDLGSRIAGTPPGGERMEGSSTSAAPCGDAADAGGAALLRGVFCASVAEAELAARAGADFVAMQVALPGIELAALCRSVSVPVFARGISPPQAWALGASGVNEIGETHARRGTT